MKLLTVRATCFHNPSHHHTNHDTVYQLCPNQKVDTAARQSHSALSPAQGKVHQIYRMLNTDSNTEIFTYPDPQETKACGSESCSKVKIKTRLDMNRASPGAFALSQSGEPITPATTVLTWLPCSTLTCSTLDDFCDNSAPVLGSIKTCCAVV